MEDKKENWLLLERLLVDAGFQVQVAEDGLEAIETFRTWRPHLIWMDIRLPLMGGVEATSKIRLLEGGREVRIVALSASALAQERQHALAAGLDDFVRKPYRRDEIFDCMARNLGVRYLYREGESLRQADPIPAILPDLAMLPEDLREELLDAVLHLDSGRIQEVIGRVREEDAQAGEFLARAAEQFAYSKILKALGEGQQRRPASV